MENKIWKVSAVEYFVAKTEEDALEEFEDFLRRAVCNVLKETMSHESKLSNNFIQVTAMELGSKEGKN